MPTYIHDFFPGLTNKKILNWNLNEHGKIILTVIQYSDPKNPNKDGYRKISIKPYRIKFRSFTFSELSSTLQDINNKKFNLVICNPVKFKNKGINTYAIAINIHFQKLEAMVKSIESVIPVEFIKLQDGYVQKSHHKTSVIYSVNN